MVLRLDAAGDRLARVVSRSGVSSGCRRPWLLEPPGPQRPGAALRVSEHTAQCHADRQGEEPHTPCVALAAAAVRWAG